MGTKDNVQALGKKLGNDFRFIAPKDVPVFEPSIEEFQDPLAYIKSIRPLAEQTGICKIKPPQNWQPPFTVDIDNFKFTPRKQRLNELEANTRIKLNFLDQIAKFWDLQGSALKIPQVQNKPLDLYALYKLVKESGGAETVTKEKKWTLIAKKIGLSSDKELENVLKHHFEKILLPYDIFQQNNCTGNIKVEMEKEVIYGKFDQDYKPHGIVSRQAIKPPQEKYCRRSQLELRTSAFGEDKPKTCRSKELQRLQFYGAGPKMAGYQYLNEEDMKNKTRGKKVNYNNDPLAKYTCQKCGGDDMDRRMLPCDTCDHYYHMFCLVPPMQEIPKDYWSCPKCVAKEVSKPMEAFGFEQAERDYTLQEFGEKADKFKADYFSSRGCLVPLDVVEREFWRILSSVDEDVTVEYGADLHTMDHGSGFPTKFTPNLHPVDAVYAHSGWNLNNIPILEDSVLGHISADISGMKVPWMYVGMCFAAFCWHNEDHWSYSINYLHWGEPKTWYGVPGSQAEKFEAAMKKAAPELFDSQPDLLHQLVTIMNPNTLMKEGVPIFRTDQHAGEFVLTFPRAYHAGFNQGFNFAEAVNFAPADWLSIGRECVEHYSALRRFCVFSHDELVCIMAQKPQNLNKAMATATYKDVLQMFKNEQKLRKSLLEWGVQKTELELFEQFPDDARQCDVCKTTCFLSAVGCECADEKLVCLRHYTSLCGCTPDNHVFKYRYTMHELADLVRKLKKRADAFDAWLADVRDALDPGFEKKKELQELKQLLQEAEEKKFPHSDLLERIAQIVEHGEKCAKVAEGLQKRRSKCGKVTKINDLLVADKHALTLEDLILFNSEIELSPCHIKECDDIGKLLRDVKIFQNEASELLQQNTQEISVTEKLLEKGISLDVNVPELSALMSVFNRLKFLDTVRELQENIKQLSIEDMQEQLKIGSSLTPDNAISEALPELQKILQQAETWQAKAKAYVEVNPKMDISTTEALLLEAESIPAFLPLKMYLQEVVEKASEWNYQAEALKAKQYVAIESLEQCVKQGKSIPVHLELLAGLELKLRNAENWKYRAARAFLRKRCVYSLTEVLLPNGALNQQTEQCGIKWMGDVEQEQMAATYREAAEIEKVAACHIQTSNLQKRVSNSDLTTYCICAGSVSENMMQCELCKDLFHFTCLPISKKTDAISAKDKIFFCPTCIRSRRPPLMVILSLVVSLYKLDVRMPEGEALLYLAERALKWVKHAREALSREEIKSFIEKLSPSLQESIKAELGKCGKLAKIAHGLFGINDPDVEHDKILDGKFSDLENAPNLEENNGDARISSYVNSEDASFLTKDIQSELDELFMNGSLIQASFPELQCIWRILKITKPKFVMPKIDDIMANEKIAGKRKPETGDNSEPIGKRLRQQREKQTIKIVDVQGAVQLADEQSTNGDSDAPTNPLEVSNEEEEECGAPDCLKPVGESVDWVQCDGICEKWFHLNCLGLSMDDISKEKEYVCCRCKVVKASKQHAEVADEPEIIIVSISK